MGAYYKPVIITNGVRRMYWYDRKKCASQGLKLGEHSFIFNTLVIDIIALIKEKSKNDDVKVIWLCDYHEPDKNIPFKWGEVVEDILPCKFGKVKNEKESKYCERVVSFYKKNRYLFAPDKMEYVDMLKIAQKEREGNDKYAYYYHPLPVFTASEDNIMGGGDIDNNDVGNLRSIWVNQKIEVTSKRPEGAGVKEINFFYYES